MDTPEYRHSIRLLLANLAKLNATCGPDELCCLWFDDFYFPGQVRPRGYDPDIWERSQREWKQCFTVQELEILREFNAAFSAEVNHLPTAGRWQEDPSWQRVSEAAKAGLQQLR